MNHRVNLWQLRSLGVRQVLAPCAVGSLQLAPGRFVDPDQVIDRTSGRPHTVCDQEGPVVHAPSFSRTAQGVGGVLSFAPLGDRQLRGTEGPVWLRQTPSNPHS